MNNLDEEIRAIVAGVDSQENKDTAAPPQQEIQDVYLLIVREHEEVAEDQAQVVESTPAPVRTQQDSFLSAYMFVCFSLLLILATLTFQLYSLFNPPIATITIIPKSQQVTLNGTIQLGRLLPPITLSLSQTAPTTGHGHQDARAATGYITFHNGQFQSVTIAAGTIFTGASGIQVVTNQIAIIPAAVPPSFGYVTVSAHAITAGLQGNIPAYDINEACCATSVLAKNTNSFDGGQDERTYTTVTQPDIYKLSTVLKTTLAQSITGALQGQLKSEEQIQLLPCSPTVTSDHKPGEEATSVKVTVSEICSAIAYKAQELENKASGVLATQAQRQAGAGYSIIGSVQVHVTQATLSRTTPHLVFLSFQAQGTWIYALSRQSQEQIKKLLVGKPKDLAVKIMTSMPGIERASINWQDETKLPKDSQYIHIIVRVL